MQQVCLIKLMIFLLIIFSVTGFTQQPEARWLHEMTYDEANDQVLVFGGAGTNTIFSDLWSFKNGVWKRLSNTGPAGSIKSAFAYDAKRKRAVLFGGSGEGNKPLDETWEWDGKDWKQVNIQGPSARSHPMATYDPTHKIVIVFGGVGATGLLSDTWVYDGTSWKQKDTSGPKNCIPHGIFYDELKQRVILITFYGATNPKEASRSKNEMWAWTDSSWKKLSYNTPSTSLNSLQALAPFENGGIVLFDGDDSSPAMGKTWKFSGEKWSSAWLQGPSPRIGHGMVYNKSARKTILFGGGDRKKVFNDLWQWDSNSWTRIQ